MDGRATIYLESDEEIPSIIDRLKIETTENILLVVPKASIVFQSVINLKLILRFAAENKKKIAIVSTDQVGRNLASRVGIAVYDSVGANSPILEPKKSSPEKEEIIDLTKGAIEKSDVVVHHFQDDKTPILPSKPEIQQLDIAENEATQNVPIDQEATKISPQKYPKIISEGYGQNNKKKKLKIIIISALIVFIIGIYFFYPKATVTLKVAGEDFENSNQLVASTKLKEADLSNGRIPAQDFEIIKEQDQKVTATGKKNIGEKSKGTLNFLNGWSTEAQILPPGTKITKDNKTFLTTSSISIPGASLTLKEGQVVTNPGTVQGQIEATEAGDSYNLSSGKFTIADLPADRQGKIYAESTQSLSGGSTREVTVVTKEDVEGAKENINKTILEVAKKELADQAKGLMILDNAIKIETQEEKPSVTEGTEASEFNLKIKSKVSALAFSQTAFRDGFLFKVKEKVPNDKELFNLENNEIVTVVKGLDLNEKEVIIEGLIRAKLGPKFDSETIRSQMTGKSISQGLQITKSILGVKDASISIKPNWMFGKLPFYKNQIDLKIDYQ